MESKFQERKSDGPKRPTSKDVAEMAGVSRATVSAYINKTRYVSPELCMKIQDSIDKLNYAPNELARSLKTKRSRTIGLIIPVLSSFYMPMLNSINEIALENNYSFLLGSSQEDSVRERDILRIFLSKQISGILVVPSSCDNKDLISEINNSGTPVVQVNRKIPGLKMDFVVSKIYDTFYYATENLIKKGRKNISLISFELYPYGELDKKNGYLKAMSDYNLKENIIKVRRDNKFKIIESLDKFFYGNKDIDGLICTTSTSTVIALQFLKKKSFRIPKDISFIGYDDTEWSLLYNPPLTVIYEKIYEMGKRSAMILIDRIKNKDKGTIKEIFLEIDFIKRESC